MVNFVTFPPDINTVVWSNNYLTFIRIYVYISSSANQQSSSVFPCHPTFTVDFSNNDTFFCSSSFVTFRCKFPSYGSTAERMLFIVIKFGGYFIQRCPTILFTRRFSPTSCRAVNNFRLPFRGWFSTVPVDRYFFTRLSIVNQGPINQKYTTFSLFYYATLRSILWFLCSTLGFCNPSRLSKIYRKEAQQT